MPLDAAPPNTLGRVGLKATLPRLKILELFRSQAQRHLSAEDVYRLLTAARAEVGLATVYRVLAQLEQAGLLKRSNFQTGKAIYELDDSMHHDHLVCVDCGRVEEFHDAEIEHRQTVVCEQRGFRLQEHALSLYGSCTKPNCEHRRVR
ncbi:ferric iron uptake transcriptional regulator [Variovorax boronicumulans]|uniref:ferric iron uptake transcriptional regulator n=1 Tax=Variovorax boronicumulans TaxID=436515 RepID=UPI0033967573